MALSEYFWFWQTSWKYMRGNRLEFWLNIIPATIKYRKDVLKEMQNGSDNDDAK